MGGEVEPVSLLDGMVQNGEGDRVRVRNYLVSAKGWIQDVSKSISINDDSMRTSDLVLDGTSKISIPWYTRNERTYQAFGENLELTLDFQALLFESVYKGRSTPR